MSECIDDFRAMKEMRKADREFQRSETVPKILKLRDFGFEVVKMNEYQYRVDGAVDFYPTRERYHILKTGQRGYFNDPVMFMYNQFRKAAGK